MPNLLDLPPELIPFITKYLPIQDLKNIWKTEVIREIRKRLIVDCTFIDRKTTVKALIDPIEDLGIGTQMLARKYESGKLKSLPRYLNKTFTNFVVIEKLEYDLVHG
ncbi:5111_t:CDS:2 [Paraglomus occultum]|uniref:5111_t:CDS:1 n=1 Tax=Paraglomus occultum TaxID=144539 RepID=A0A9N9AS48_9GLOM|nr:5111_t:CDS:2 [Paraglomus occultum]